MPDTYEKKPDADDYDILNPSTGLCAGFNALSFGCIASRSRIPPFGEDVEIVNVQQFCSAGPYPEPGSRPQIADANDDANPGYFSELSAWGKAHARRIKFSEWCRKVIPPEQGQCPVDYTWELTTTETFNSGFADRTETINGTSTGPFTLVRSSASKSSGDTNATPVGYDATGGVDPKQSSGSIYFETMVVDNFTVTRVDGQPDDCGEETTEPVEPPDTPPEEPPNTPPGDSLQPPIGPEGPPGAPGPPGEDGPPGPCPTITAGDLVVGPGENDELLITDEGACTYTMSIRLRDLASEERTVLKGVQYSVTEYPDHASFQFVEGGLYFIPRCGAIVFKNDASGERSESQEIHMNTGYVRNPDRLKFDNYDLTPYVSTFIIASNGDRDIVNVLTTTLIPSD